MLTNFKTVKNSIARLVELDEMASSGTSVGLTKKETLMLERERAKLDRSLSGIREMKGLPDALLVIDVDHERIAVSEARKLGIPVVGVCDTNSSPDGIDYRFQVTMTRFARLNSIWAVRQMRFLRPEPLRHRRSKEMLMTTLR